MYPVIGPVESDERLAEIAQGGLTGVPDVLLGHHNPHPLPSSRSRRERMPLSSRRMPHSGSSVSSTSAIRWLVGRVPPGELDTGCLTNQAASSVAPDEIVRPQRLAVGQLDIDAGVVLREARHRHVRDRSAPPARRPSRPGCARMWFCNSASP